MTAAHLTVGLLLGIVVACLAMEAADACRRAWRHHREWARVREHERMRRNLPRPRSLP